MEDTTSANTGLEGEIIRERVTLLYAHDGALGAWDPNWVQNATQHLCDLFLDYSSTGLKQNTRKTEVVICHPGEIQDRCSTEGYTRRREGSGDTYRKHMCRQVQCHLCNKDLAAGSLQSCIRTVHSIDSAGLIVLEPVAHGPHTYKLALSTCWALVVRR